MTRTVPPTMNLRKLEQGAGALGFDPRPVLAEPARKRTSKKAAKPEGESNG